MSDEIQKADTNAGGIVPFDYGKDAGAGWENTDATDFSVAFLSQLQALSAEIQEDESSYIPGSKPGMCINSVTKQLYDTFSGELIVVPCITRHTVVEWVPRDMGGGFVAEHEINSDVVVAAKAANGGSMLNLKSEAGNELVETYSIFALRLESVDAKFPAELIVIPFTRTKIKRYKEIMTRLRTIYGGNKIPLFAHRLSVQTTKEKNPAGQSYYNIRLVPAVENDVLKSLVSPETGREILEAGRVLRDQVLAGLAKTNYESAEGSGFEADNTPF